MVFKSAIDELFERLRQEGKLTELSPDQVAEIDKHISKEMKDFRIEQARKQAQSIADTHRIILT